MRTDEAILGKNSYQSILDSRKKLPAVVAPIKTFQHIYKIILLFDKFSLLIIINKHDAF